VLLDRGLGDHQVGGDLVRGGRGGERLVGQRGPAQGGQHVQLTAGELGHGRTPQLGLGGDLFLRDAADPAAGRTEAEHIALVQHPARHGAPVNTRAVA
jgi:hypothetical protein